ncbi:Cof-type HAD-IIB family hydrolase [Haploplasma axanthum]|uniref:HAD hydrolase, family IIB n=1 Tax=Haploplasma axanthum TaxID=29552 RepID=A0A449BFX2_HAPAX|nr:Cof-type HAD-IIB family hydrolase [Haploplasma axanthum]VEU81327.1 HAD hydrolase, family IIB [Haploplasma axanthum]
MKKNVIFSDLDGTLLNYEDRKSFISEKNLKAIDSWIENGNFFSVATGRNIKSAKRFLEHNKFNYNLPLVLSNGTVLYDIKKNHIIYQEILNSKIIDDAVKYILSEEKALMFLITADKHYMLEPKNKEKFKMPVFDYTLITKDQIPYDSITKVSFSVTKDRSEEVLKDVKGFKSFDLLELIPSAPTYIEMINKGTSKITGIKRILEYVGINDYTIYTIGDYINDYEMIKNADVGFAPLNAHQDILEIADHVVCHHNDGAISDMIKKINELKGSK